jgi:hypothetical protein
MDETREKRAQGVTTDMGFQAAEIRATAGLLAGVCASGDRIAAKVLGEELLTRLSKFGDAVHRPHAG